MTPFESIMNINDQIFEAVKGKTPLTDRIREIGHQEPQQDFDISPIKEKAHDFITKGIYEYESINPKTKQR